MTKKSVYGQLKMYIEASGGTIESDGPGTLRVTGPAGWISLSYHTFVFGLAQTTEQIRSLGIDIPEPVHLRVAWRRPVVEFLIGLAVWTIVCWWAALWGTFPYGSGVITYALTARLVVRWRLCLAIERL